MLNISFLGYIKVELCMGPDSLYCGKWRKISKSCRELDLDLTMPIIELVQDISYYTTMYSNFMFLDQLLFESSCKNTQTHTDADADKYSIVAFCKNATMKSYLEYCHSQVLHF